MGKIFSGLCTLLLFAAFTPSTTHADPVVITNGFVTITGISGGPAYSFAVEGHLKLLTRSSRREVWQGAVERVSISGLH